MCCLKYEQDAYEAVLKRLPKVGKDIVTPDGVGVLTEINAVRERVKVRIRTADDAFDVREYLVDEVRRPGADDPAAIREQRKPQERRGAQKGAAQPAEEAEEEPKKKRYPHQKAPKNLSTDQFLEKMRESDQEDGELESPAQEKEPHKRRRRGKGRAQEEPLNRADAPRERPAKDKRPRANEAASKAKQRAKEGEAERTAAPQIAESPEMKSANVPTDGGKGFNRGAGEGAPDSAPESRGEGAPAGRILAERAENRSEGDVPAAVRAKEADPSPEAGSAD